jgi:23S rRNA pseudouridine1911/1915/1917 synthase
MQPRPRSPLIVPAELDGRPLDGVLRTLCQLSWGRARSLVSTGKVYVDGQPVLRPESPVAKGVAIEIHMSASRNRSTSAVTLDRRSIVFADAHVVVVDKPPGVSTVPYERDERDTLDRLVARLIHRSRGVGSGPAMPLGVVHRLDKETSGLVVFTRTFAAKKILGHQFRLHTVHRRYLALAHGSVSAKTITSRLVADRGDGLRGSTRSPDLGVLAITHVEPVEPLAEATLVRCRLETGKTHQIRIHLSEDGHPIVGERVYIRRYEGPELSAPRLMLHAAELGFTHPISGRPVHFESKLPPDFDKVLRSLRG